METLFLLIGIVISVSLIYIVYRLNTQSLGGNDQTTKIMLDLMKNLREEVHVNSGKNREELQKRLDTINDLLHQHQMHSSKSMQKQFNDSQKIINDVVKKLTQIENTNQQVLSFTEQMKSLESILKNPKQRGVLGEYMLEALLSNVLQPNQYKMQYSFKNGEIVDAAIFFNKKIIPIDAKFSLEKYNKIMETTDVKAREKLEKEFKADIKKRIDETSKYIRPNEDTTEFAFMFIPAEGIYYNLLIYNVGTVNVNSHDLVEYAFSKRVIIVSPTSFFAYLETVLQGLKALKMAESVEDIKKNVENLGRHIKGYETNMTKLGKHLGTTVNMYNQASREFRKIDKDIYKLTDGKEGGDIEEVLLEKPSEVE